MARIRHAFELAKSVWGTPVLKKGSSRKKTTEEEKRDPAHGVPLKKSAKGNIGRSVPGKKPPSITWGV